MAFGFIRRQRPDNRLDLRPRHGPRAQIPRFAQQADHARFNADRAIATVERHSHRRTRFLNRVGVGRRAWPPGAVRRGRDNAKPRLTQHRQSQIVRRHAQGDAVEPGARQVAGLAGIAHRHHQRQRPRPKRFGQGAGAVVEHADLLGSRDITDMDDQRIETRPALGLEHLDHGVRIIGARAQPIDGLGRQVDQLTGAQGGNGSSNIWRHLTFPAAALAFSVISTLTPAGILSVPA